MIGLVFYVEPPQVWARYNHLFDTVPAGVMVFPTYDKFSCPCGQQFEAERRPRPDDAVMECPKCADWHVISWRKAA